MTPAHAMSFLPAAARALAVAILIFTAGCGSSSSQLPPGVEQPEIRIAQVFGGDALFQMRGRVSIQYVIEVTNPSTVPITLERVQLRNIGAGAYDVNETVYIERQEIAPGETRQITFSAWGFSHGGSMNASVPTTVRAVAYFDSPAGKFRGIVTQSMGGLSGTVG